MIAFHNDQEVKEKYLSRVLAHQKADELIKGKYWQNGKGCAVGCTIHSPEHANYETELGIPEWLARVEDKIFEGLANYRAQLWPAEFLSAINIGADLEETKAPFMIFVCEFALEQFDHQKFPDCKKAVEGVIDLWRLPQQQREAAADAAYSAARAAADAADAAYVKFADKLLEILRECK